MGNCCGAEADQDNTSIGSGPSINTVERRGKVWIGFACSKSKTFYSLNTSQEHKQQHHSKLLQVGHYCNTPFNKPKDRQNHEDRCQV